MNRADITNIVQSVLIEHFNVVDTPIIWDNTLENLNDNFRFLGFLLELEKLLQSKFKIKIFLIEHISVNIHTSEDIVTLIFETFQDIKMK